MEIRSAPAFAESISGARKSAGLSQQQLADMVGVSRKTIVQLESVECMTVMLGTAMRVMRTLKLSMDVSTKESPDAEALMAMSHKRRTGAAP